MRRFVLAWAVSATLFGLLLLVSLPLDRSLRGAACAVWLLLNWRQVSVIAKGYKRCRRIRIEQDGSVSLQSADGCWFAATLQSGSFVLSNIAWLRFRSRDGQRFAELVRPGSAGNKGWRHLQVIWRHIGAGR